MIIINIIIDLLSFMVLPRMHNKSDYKPNVTGVGPRFVYATIMKFGGHPPVVEITRHG